jgi:hypothetical protein
VTTLGGFDIIDNGTLGSGVALLGAQVGAATTSTLFTVNLNSTGITNQPQGSVKAVGTIGSGELIRAMAIAPPVIEFAQETSEVFENETTASIDIVRTGGTGTTATVRFDTANGSALAGLDYTAVLNQLVTFNRGETRKTVQIPIINDTTAEPTETVLLSLSNVTGGATQLGMDASAVLNIRMVPPPPPPPVVVNAPPLPPVVTRRLSRLQTRLNGRLFVPLSTLLQAGFSPQGLPLSVVPSGRLPRGFLLSSSGLIFVAPRSLRGVVRFTYQLSNGATLSEPILVIIRIRR